MFLFLVYSFSHCQRVKEIIRRKKQSLGFVKVRNAVMPLCNFSPGHFERNALKILMASV